MVTMGQGPREDVKQELRKSRLLEAYFQLKSLPSTHLLHQRLEGFPTLCLQCDRPATG